MTPRAVLVELPGVGKTVTGRRLAKILGVDFADSDDWIETAQGRSVREIFDSAGEAEFRAIEATVVLAALEEFQGVLALGGGALTTATIREGLSAAGAPVVLLRAPLPTLTHRVGSGRTRPLLVENPSARLAALAEEREPLYRQAATLVVDTDNRTPGQVAAQIAARLHEKAAP